MLIIAAVFALFFFNIAKILGTLIKNGLYCAPFALKAWIFFYPTATLFVLIVLAECLSKSDPNEPRRYGCYEFCLIRFLGNCMIGLKFLLHNIPDIYYCLLANFNPDLRFNFWDIVALTGTIYWNSNPAEIYIFQTYANREERVERIRVYNEEIIIIRAERIKILQLR